MDDANSTEIDTVSDEDSHSLGGQRATSRECSLPSTSIQPPRLSPDLANHLHDTEKIVTPYIHT